FELFNPSRRSSSAICAFRAAISAACAAISAMSSSRDGSAGESAFIESLNRSPIPMSSKTYRLDFAKTPTQPGQGQFMGITVTIHNPNALIPVAAVELPAVMLALDLGRAA